MRSRASASTARTDDREVLLCADGPILVPGPVTVEDEEGVRHHSERPVVAICRCGATGSAPWCDGSHKLVRRSAGPRAVPRPRTEETPGRALEDY